MHKPSYYFTGASTTVTDLFHLDQVTGVLTTMSSSFDRDPNTGGVEYYDVIVKAIDQGTSAHSAERTLRVGLIDVNDNTPTFAQTIYTVTFPETTIASKYINFYFAFNISIYKFILLRLQ